MKKNVFVITFKGLPIKQIAQIFLEGGSPTLKPFLTNGERIKAEHLWISFVQNEIIIKSDNYQQLKKDLNLYFDQENIRC